MFRKSAALKAGGFVADGEDFAEDYDLWLRMGKDGKMHNFQSVFARYQTSDYNREKFRAFLAKQLRLISQHRKNYPFYYLAKVMLKLRLLSQKPPTKLVVIKNYLRQWIHSTVEDTLERGGSPDEVGTLEGENPSNDCERVFPFQLDPHGNI